MLSHYVENEAGAKDLQVPCVRDSIIDCCNNVI